MIKPEANLSSLPTEIKSLILDHISQEVWNQANYHPFFTRGGVLHSCYLVNGEFNSLCENVVWKCLDISRLHSNSLRSLTDFIQSRSNRATLIQAINFSLTSMNATEKDENGWKHGVAVSKSIELDEARGNLLVAFLGSLPNLKSIGFYTSQWKDHYNLIGCGDIDTQVKLLTKICKSCSGITDINLSGKFDSDFLVSILPGFNSLERVMIDGRIGEDDNEGLALALSSLVNLRFLVFYPPGGFFELESFPQTHWVAKLEELYLINWVAAEIPISIYSFLAQFNQSLQKLHIAPADGIFPDSRLRHPSILLQQSLIKLKHFIYRGEYQFLDTLQSSPLQIVEIEIFPERLDEFLKFFKNFLDQHLLLDVVNIRLKWSDYAEFEKEDFTAIGEEMKASLASYLVENGRDIRLKVDHEIRSGW